MLGLALVFSGRDSLAQTQTAGPDYVNTWLVLGTFDGGAPDAGFQKAWFDESNAIVKEGDVVGGKRWGYFDDRLFSRNYDNYQDLWSYFRLKKKESITSKLVYAHTYVYSEKAQSVVLYVGADQRSTLRLNGAVVLETVAGQWKRDSAKVTVQLQPGWNRLLMKVANKGDTRLGFYLRISDEKGARVKGLTWSVRGAAPQMEVTTKGMADIGTSMLPTGWREWSYVSAQTDLNAVFPKGSEIDKERWILYAVIRNADSTQRDPGSIVQAGEFRLQAQGGQPPYKWSVMGNLPPGLEIALDGTLLGTVADFAEAKAYRFTVRARDANGLVAKKEMSLEVKERPNKWYEEARLVSLIHSPEHLEENKIGPMVELMHRQGFQVGMPISYNNGDLAFRWPSRYSPPGTRDIIGEFKKAFVQEQMKFGMYMGNVNLEHDKRSLFKNEEQHLMVEEALLKYHPKALWFDWSTVEAEAIDAMYSMIRTFDPEIVIVINGAMRGTFGDWDEICFEGWGSWGWDMWRTWPVEIPWPKKHSPESWRLITETGLTPGTRLLPQGPPLNSPPDWQEYLRVQLSLIGEGFVANIDHTHSLRLGKRTWDQPADAKPVPYEEAPLIKVHEEMARWASPPGLPPLYTAYTQVNPGPLGEAPWGYNMINVKRDTIYLHLLKNPRGKTGMPPEKSISVIPINEEVVAVTWMNTNRPLKFRQELTSTNKLVTIYLDGVTPDPVDTIIKIQLKKPLPIPVPVPRISIPAGNLASFQPARLLGPKGGADLLPSKGNLASYGNDGNPQTISVGAGYWAWAYEVDLGKIHPIKKVSVLFTERGFPTESEVLLSDDGTTWTRVGMEKRDGPGKANYEFAPVEARYVRVRAITPDGPKQPGIQMGVAELEVYE